MLFFSAGAEPIVVAERGHVTLYPVPQLPSERTLADKYCICTGFNYLAAHWSGRRVTLFFCFLGQVGLTALQILHHSVHFGFVVIAMMAQRIVDTNGAGDAFVGGFLAALLRGRKLADCCQAGPVYCSQGPDKLTAAYAAFSCRLAPVPLSP